VLLDLTAIMSLLPLLYIFASLPVLRRRAAGRNEHVTLVPGGDFVCWLWGAIGFATTAFAVITSMIPPEGANHALFYAKVIGGSVLLIGTGMVFFVRGRAAARRA